MWMLLATQGCFDFSKVVILKKGKAVARSCRMDPCELTFVCDLSNQDFHTISPQSHGITAGLTVEPDGNKVNCERYAILVKNVEYSHRPSKENVLDKLNMSVRQASIYGLTGSSGCGKTTLISCILGILPLSCGNIHLYGCNINSPYRQQLLSIPGKGVGFMPQEMSLYSSFTILEALSYFSRLYGMSATEIKDAAKDLFNLLKLSPSSNLIGSLSGGQQRRVSFAVSHIHSPKLLVLDEPTVGMDPLLRKRIWDYLRHLVNDMHVTVLVTSHYLDELRNADKVGMMRNGRIICEDSPENLLAICNTGSLDDVVLTVCKHPELFESQALISADESGNPCTDWADLGTLPESNKTQESWARTKALFSKNILHIFRNIPLLLFVACIPAMHMTVGYLIGSELSQLAFGVVNGELSMAPFHNINTTSGNSCPVELENELDVCKLNLLSCRYLNHLANKDILLVYFNSENDAISAAKNGDIYGYTIFSTNFSDSLVSRALLDSRNDSVEMASIIEQSCIIVRLDESNTITARHLLEKLLIAQEDFLKILFSACEVNKKWDSYPLHFGTAIFGKQGAFNLRDYIVPAAPVPLLFFFAVISTGLRLVDERNSGMLKRMLVSGVKLPEIIAAYTASEALITVAQSVITLAVVLALLQHKHSPVAPLVFNVFLFFLLAGFTGMSLGFLLGSACTDQIQVAIVGIAFVLPNMLLTGAVWPIEAMPGLMQKMVLLLPGSLPVEALRSIWGRGLELSHPNVWPGIVVLIVYILIFNILILIYHKLTRKMSLV